MRQLLKFLFRYKTFVTLIVLESICFWVMVKANRYHAAKYFTSASGVAASLAELSTHTINYFGLREQNRKLAEENATLRQRLLQIPDTSFLYQEVLDSMPASFSAKVVDHSVLFSKNYITINKGAADGVKPGMGVVGPDGIVGQVLHTTTHYASVLSLLHSRSMVSALHQPTKTICSVVWDGKDPLLARMKYLPRHVNVQPGDSIVTSGYGGIYPSGYLIGVVNSAEKEGNGAFSEVQIKLSTRFYHLSYVYLLKLEGQEEKDSLKIKSRRP